MKAYWNSLNDRERWMLGVGVACCVAYLFYVLIYAPLHNAVADKSLQLAEKQTTLAWMQQARLEHKATETPQTLTNSQLLTLLANQLRSTSFQQFPYQLEQTGVGDIQLSFAQVPFNDFITWLWSINKKYTVSIKQFNAEHTDLGGVAKVMVVVTAAARHGRPKAEARSPR